MNQLRRAVDMASTPAGIINMIKNHNIPMGSDTKWRLADPYCVTLLDDFGEEDRLFWVASLTC